MAEKYNDKHKKSIEKSFRSYRSTIRMKLLRFADWGDYLVEDYKQAKIVFSDQNNQS